MFETWAASGGPVTFWALPCKGALGARLLQIGGDQATSTNGKLRSAGL